MYVVYKKEAALHGMESIKFNKFIFNNIRGR